MIYNWEAVTKGLKKFRRNAYEGFIFLLVFSYLKIVTREMFQSVISSLAVGHKLQRVNSAQRIR